MGSEKFIIFVRCEEELIFAKVVPPPAGSPTHNQKIILHMKRHLNPLYSLLLLLGLTLGMVSCSSDNPSDPGDGNGNGNGEPTISTFTASPSTLAVGNPTTLAWTTTDATTISIDQGLGVQTGTSVVVYPSATTTYTLTATNSKGTTTKSVTVNVSGTIDRVEIVPSTPQTMQPGGTMQFTAKAYGNANNDLNLPQSAFTWTSNNTTLVQISQTGLVSVPASITAGGQVQIVASVGGVSSSPVPITVQLQKATTLVIFHGRYDIDNDWSLYNTALQAAGVVYDQLVDEPTEVATTISLDVLAGYERVFYFDRNDGMHAATQSLLKLYASMPNKRLIVMGDSYLFNNNASMLAAIGLSNEGYFGSDDVNSSFVGGAGTVMQGFNFDFTPDFSWVSDMELSVSNPATPAFTTTLLSSGEPVITAIQANVGSSKFFYAGFVLENVQANLRDDFIAKLMTM
jgi:hypothetical protein